MHIGAAMFFTDYSMTPAELGVALEERGFESVWAPEHSHIPLTRKSEWPGGGELPKKYYDAMDPFVTLTAAAAVTKKLKVGTGVCLVNQRDPIQTAKAVASIDQVSGGRFLFGVGNGWNQDEMENHGTNFESRHKLVRERIEAMKVIWTKSKAEYHGDMVKFDPMMAWPKPVQKPHPPVLVGGAFPYGARRAHKDQFLCGLRRQAFSCKATGRLFHHSRFDITKQFSHLGTSRLIARDHDHGHTKMTGERGIQPVLACQNIIQPNICHCPGRPRMIENCIWRTVAGVITDEYHPIHAFINALHHREWRR